MIKLPGRRVATVTASLAVSMALLAPPAGAVSGGELDSANTYANVGRLEVDLGVGWFGFCTGTLVAPDAILTVAHCITPILGSGFPLSAFRVNFDPLATELMPDAAPDAYAVASVALPDGFGPGSGSAGLNQLGSPFDDIGILYLSGPVPGVAPAPIAGLGYADDPSVRGAALTTVGYGGDGFRRGNNVSQLEPPIFHGGRSFRTDVRILGSGPYPDRYLQVSVGNCFGDSGGPLFHEDVIIGLIVWVNGWSCDATGFDFRLDSAPAQAFLEGALDN